MLYLKTVQTVGHLHHTKVRSQKLIPQRNGRTLHGHAPSKDVDAPSMACKGVPFTEEGVPLTKEGSPFKEWDTPLTKWSMPPNLFDSQNWSCPHFTVVTQKTRIV